jgi:L-asparaginase/Glu-tRNA(Gln) amidotransferase subunit D
VANNIFDKQVLLDAGVIPGADMTPEAALSKLSYVLSKSDWSHDTKRQVSYNDSYIEYVHKPFFF